MARQKIEMLRDTLFTIRGLRWILCGAHGILHGIVASQRLVGHLQEPVQVFPLALDKAHDVLKARVKTYPIDGRAPYLPLEADDFHRVYMIVHRNLRNTLAYADEYCTSVAESGTLPQTPSEKSARFDSWLARRARAIRDSIRTQVGPRAMQLFHEVIRKLDGDFAPSDYETLGFNKLEAMRSHVKSLEDVGLVEAQRDDIDKRRKSISVTGKGWLVHWCEVTHSN